MTLVTLERANFELEIHQSTSLLLSSSHFPPASFGPFVGCLYVKLRAVKTFSFVGARWVVERVQRNGILCKMKLKVTFFHLSELLIKWNFTFFTIEERRKHHHRYSAAFFDIIFLISPRRTFAECCSVRENMAIAITIKWAILAASQIQFECFDWNDVSSSARCCWTFAWKHSSVSRCFAPAGPSGSEESYQWEARRLPLSAYYKQLKH